MKRLLSSLTIVTFVLILGAVLVIYAQGNRIGKDGKLTGSGILRVDTTPNNARVLINGVDKGESDTNIENLLPGTYSLRVEKEHYQPWQKEVEIKKGLVTPVKLNLFPTNPALNSLTFDGVAAPALSNDRRKLAYTTQSADKKGVWVFNMNGRQIFFGNTSTNQIVADTDTVFFSNSTLEWSPNDEQVLSSAQTSTPEVVKVFLLESDQLNSNPEDVTARVEEIRKTWAEQLLAKQQEQLKKLGDEATSLALEAKSITFSPDEDAVLIVKNDGSTLVYDTKPSPVPGSLPQTSPLPTAEKYLWLGGEAKNVVGIDKGTISILDTDGTNRASIFNGNFDPKALYSWPDGSKLVILINFNQAYNPLPNFYTVELD